jgi:hypothetical protein
MDSCANCLEPALFVYSANSTEHTFFCADHLPRFLYSQRDLGLLPTTAQFEVTRKETLALLSGQEPTIKETPVEAAKTPRKASSTAKDSGASPEGPAPSE